MIRKFLRYLLSPFIRYLGRNGTTMQFICRDELGAYSAFKDPFGNVYLYRFTLDECAGEYKSRCRAARDHLEGVPILTQYDFEIY